MRDLDRNSKTGGSVRLTLGTTATNGSVVTKEAQGPKLEIVSCLIQVHSTAAGTLRMNIGARASATVGAAVPTGGALTPLPISNLNQIYFLSTAEGDIIDILYRQ